MIEREDWPGGVEYKLFVKARTRLKILQAVNLAGWLAAVGALAYLLATQ